MDTLHARSVMTYTAGRVTVDGHDAGGRIIAPSDQLNFASISGLTTSATSFRPFTFWPLDWTDDDSYLDGTSGQRLGEITLEIWIVVPGPQYLAPGYAVPLPVKLHEQSRNGVAHCIRFGPEIPTPPAMQTTSRKISRLATFIFKYRSLDLLRADGFVPCEPQTRAGEKRRAVERPECDIKREPESGNEQADAKELKALEDRMVAIRARQPMAMNGAKRVKVESCS